MTKTTRSRKGLTQESVTPQPDKPKGAGGRPSYQPNSEHEGNVRALAATGVSKEEIAKFLKMDPKTLSKYYGDVIETSQLALLAKATTTLVKGMHSLDEDRAISASKFVLSTKGRAYGWSTNSSEPAPHPLDDMDLKKLTNDEVMELIRILEKSGVKLPKANLVQLPPP